MQILEDRVVPSVSATLQNGILNIAADTTGGTSQVEIIQSQPPTQIAVEDTGSLVGSFDITQIQQIQFQYNLFALTLPVNATQMTLTGFAVNEADLSLGDGSLTAGAHATLPDGTAVNLAGAVNANGTFDLAGAAAVQVANFPLQANFDLTDHSLTVGAHLSIPSVLDVDLAGSLGRQGHYDLTGAADVSVDGFTLPGTSFELTDTALTASTSLAIGNDSVTLSGSVDNQGQFDLTGTANVTVAGFGINANFTLTNASLAVSGTLNLPSIGDLSFSGAVNAQGQYNLSAAATLTISGLPVTATFTLTNTNLAVATSVDLPLVGNIILSGTVDSRGHFALTANAPDINILFVTLTNTSVTLTNSSLTVSGQATGLPLLRAVDFTGTVNGNSYTLTATLPSVSILGFTLSNVSATLNSTTLSVSAQASNLPLVGTVDFNGTIHRSGFKLSATAQNVDLLGFIHFAGIALTLDNRSLSLSAATSLPLVGDVTFTGDINASGNFTIAATAPSFTLLGFLNLTNTTVSLSFPNPSLTVAAQINLDNIVTADFTGTIRDATHFSFSGHAALSICGFDFGDANMAFGDDSSEGITIGPFTTPPLPVVGAVTLSGSFSYGANGLAFAFQGIVPGPIIIDGIPFRDITVGFLHDDTHDALTLGAGVGLVYGPFDIAGIDFVGTVDANGDFRLTASVDAFRILGFSMAQGQLVLQSSNNLVTLTLDAEANIPLIETTELYGTLIPADGEFSLTAIRDITVAGFTLSDTQFTFDQANGMHLHSHTDIPTLGTVDFDGSVTREGDVSLHGQADFTILGTSIAHANLSLSTTRLDVSADVTIPSVGTLTFAGALSSDGHFDLATQATVQYGDFSVMVDLDLTNDWLSAQADVMVPILDQTYHFTAQLPSIGYPALHAQATIVVAGFTLSNTNFDLDLTGMHLHSLTQLPSILHDTYVQFDGELTVVPLRLSLIASADLYIAGFDLAGARLELDNTHLAVSATRSLPFFQTISFAGSVNIDGQFNLQATDAFGVFGPFQLASSTLTLNNSGLQVDTGVTVPGVGLIHFLGALSSTGRITAVYQSNITLAGFTLWDVTYRLDSDQGTSRILVSMTRALPFVAATTFTGTLDNQGNFDLTAQADFSPAGFLIAHANLHLTNTSLDVAGDLNFPGVVTVHFAGQLLSNGQFTLTGNAQVGLGGFTAAHGAFTLTNSGATLMADVNVVVATVHFVGSIDSHGNYSLTGSANVSLAGFPVTTVSFTLTNASGAAASANVNVFVATVHFTGRIQTNGSFSLTGSASVGLAGFPTATASFTLTNSGVSFSASINVLVATVNFAGSVDTHGNYRLTGSAAATFAGFHGSGSFTLTNSGLSFSGSVNVLVATINVSGSISSAGVFQFVVSTRMSFAGFGAGGSVTLRNNGLSVSATFDVNVLGYRMSVSGTVNANGTYTFTAHFSNINFGPVSSGLDLTLTNHGLSAHVHAAVDVSTSVSFGFWSLRVGFRGSFDVSFNINTNGTYSASGTFAMTAYAGISLSVGIGFSIDNHHFTIKTSSIGFSVWGIGFHPFPDATLSY
jgi:hypothetical protein